MYISDSCERDSTNDQMASILLELLTVNNTVRSYSYKYLHDGHKNSSYSNYAYTCYTVYSMWTSTYET